MNTLLQSYLKSPLTLFSLIVATATITLIFAAFNREEPSDMKETTPSSPPIIRTGPDYESEVSF